MKRIAILLVAALLVMTVSALAEGTLELPPDLKSIGEEAFAGDTSLDRVILNDGIEEIGPRAFAGSTLRNINLPSSLTSIDDTAFDGPDKVTVEVEEGTEAYDWALINGYAAEYPETPHPYGRNKSMSFSYKHPGGADALLVTFSEDSVIATPDSCHIRWSDGNYWIEEEMLRGATFPIPSDRFRIDLESKSNGGGVYGFRVVDIQALTWAEYQTWLQNNPFRTRVRQDGTLSITGYSGSATDVVIPSAINGKPVTAIEAWAFEDCDYITSLVISEGITDIGTGAFYDGLSATSLTLPSTLKTIGDEAFSGWEKLPTLNIPEGVVSIGTRAFIDLNSITSVTIPGSVRQLGSKAFVLCEMLSVVDIGSGVTSIGDEAFDACGALSRVAIPASVTSLGENVFSGCPETLSLYVESGSAAETWAGKMGFARAGNVTQAPYNGWIEYKAVEVPAYPESEHDYASDTDETWEYTYPADVDALAITFTSRTRMERYCDFLYLTDSNGDTLTFTGGMLSGKTVMVPANQFTLNLVSDGSGEDHGFSITQISPASQQAYENWLENEAPLLPYTFRNYSGKYRVASYEGEETEIVIPDSYQGKPVFEIYRYAFESNGTLESVVIPDSVTTISAGAFGSCSNLTRVVVPASVQSIDESAFEGSDQVVLYVQPRSYAEKWAIEHDIAYEYDMTEEELEAWEEYAESHPYETVTLDDGTLSIVGYYGEDYEIVIPAEIDGIAVSEIAERAFAGNEVIENVSISEGIANIGDSAFRDCQMLYSVTIPGSVQRVDDYAFADCTGLETIEIGDGVEEIGEYAFGYEDNGLRTVAIPASVTSISQTAFGGCPGLETVYVQKNSAADKWARRQGFILIGDAEVEEYEGWNEYRAIILPETQHPYDTGLTYWTFEWPEEVAGLEITFSDDTELADNDSLHVMGVEDYGWYNWRSLAGRSILVGGSFFDLELVIDGSPYGYYGFRVKKIAPLTEAQYAEKLEYMQAHPFLTQKIKNGGVTLSIVGYLGQDADIVIPASIDGLAVTRIGEQAFNNKEFSSVVVSEGIAEIGRDAFRDCENLAEVTLPEGITDIDNYAFAESGLTEIVLPESLTYLGYSAFAYCENLSSVHLPGNLTTIEMNTFQNCTALEAIEIPSNVTYISDNAFEGCDDLVIQGEAGSYAETWANNNGFTFEAK